MIGETERRYICFRCRQPAPDPVFVKTKHHKPPEDMIGQYWRNDYGHAYCLECLDADLNPLPLELEA